MVISPLPKEEAEIVLKGEKFNHVAVGSVSWPGLPVAGDNASGGRIIARLSFFF
jgi:hypothetical protein